MVYRTRSSTCSDFMCIIAPVWGILEWYGHCWRQCIEVRSDSLSTWSAKNIFHLHFSVVWMGSHSTVVLCTALSPTSAFHVIRDRTKEVYTEGSLWKNQSGRQLARKFQDNETWAAGHFELHACTTFTSIERHHVGATPPRLYSPRLLIVRRQKSGTAKTVPAVLAVPALHYKYRVHIVCIQKLIEKIKVPFWSAIKMLSDGVIISVSTKCSEWMVYPEPVT